MVLLLECSAGQTGISLLLRRGRCGHRPLAAQLPHPGPCRCYSSSSIWPRTCSSSKGPAPLAALGGRSRGLATEWEAKAACRTLLELGPGPAAGLAGLHPSCSHLNWKQRALKEISLFLISAASQ